MEENRPMIYMNTWKNYNENGADLSAYGFKDIASGWLTPEQALDFAEEHAEDEPFINDTDNFPFEVGEYDNIEEVYEMLSSYENFSENEQKAFETYLECISDNKKEALEVIERGDYYFYPDVSTYEELAYEIENECGSLEDMVGKDRISYYIDEDAMRRDYQYDVEDMVREDGFDEVRRENPELDEDSEEFEDKVQEYVDDNLDTYLDSIIEEEISSAERGETDLSNYFDYEMFGRDLSYDYVMGSEGALIVL